MSNASDGYWTLERLQFAKTKWQEGWSASIIAAHLNGAGGKLITRGAVLGKLFRDGKLKRDAGQHHSPPGGRKPRDRKAPITRRASFRPAPPIQPQEFQMPIGPTKTLLELESDECRWAVNDGGPFVFCSAKVAAEGVPYCSAHMRRGYTPRPSGPHRAYIPTRNSR